MFHLLESYNTGELEDIVDILELYDLEKRTLESLQEKLDELAYTVSVLMNETLMFGFREDRYARPGFSPREMLAPLTCSFPPGCSEGFPLKSSRKWKIMISYNVGDVWAFTVMPRELC
ncbi:MAG TPA: hypothetical protein DCP92_17730 [Nitrospiraceae bacterium]|jgi:hypothetical protein|nr:hypothetical protein [Nitrospiraceae bacterium]